MRAGVAALATIAVLGAALAAGGCGGKGELTAPPPPLRPEPEPKPPDPSATAQKDCAQLEPSDELKPIPFDQRAITESAKLAEQARSKLRLADSAEIDRAQREYNITEAVADFITALRADPYNVPATYNLAAAYARIGRSQCVINLLTRLLQLRPHPSKRAEVEAHLDRLLGRKTALDQDFSDMRRDDRFRTLIQKMCEGTNDPTCVFGGQR